MNIQTIKIIVLLISAMIITSCDQDNKTATTTAIATNDICQILQNHNTWTKSLKESQNLYGISPAFIMGLMRQESNFQSHAKNKTSSATGFSQALDNTWGSYQKSVSSSANRTSFDDSAKFIGWYMSGMSKSINVKKTDYQSLYLAYMMGPTGFKNYKKGTFKNKNNLKHFISISKKVKSYTDTYQQQLRSCPIK